MASLCKVFLFVGLQCIKRQHAKAHVLNLAWANSCRESFIIFWVGSPRLPTCAKQPRYGEVVCQVSKVAAALLAQFAQELSQLRRGVVTQLGFLGREFGSRALGERICGIQDVIKQREGRFNLEVMGSAAAASRLLVELPCPLRWQGFER